MIEKMKQAKSAYQPHSDEVNEVRRIFVKTDKKGVKNYFLKQKIWTLCDLSLHLILTKLKNVDMREYSLDQVNIPRMYFQEQSADFNNKRNYLSQEFKRISTAEVVEDESAGPLNAGPAPKRPIDSLSTTCDPVKRMRNA